LHSGPQRLRQKLKSALAKECLYGVDWGAMNEPNEIHPLRVLVAEDNPVNQMVVATLLRRLGCQVDVVADGRKAVEACAVTAYDLVFMDCMMPLMDGYDATRAIRSTAVAGHRLPVVALTAKNLDGDRERCLAAGMDDYLTKPIEPARVRAAIERWTRRSLPREVTAPGLANEAKVGTEALALAVSRELRRNRA